MTSTTSVSAWNEPAGVAPRGTVLLLPGRGEQPGLYRRFGARIAADGYRVRVLPEAQVVLIGHGRHDVLNSASHRSVAARVVQFLESLRAEVDAPPILQEVKP